MWRGKYIIKKIAMTITEGMINNIEIKKLSIIKNIMSVK